MEKKVKVLDVNLGISGKIYWVEVLRGLWVTNRHFTVNMWRHVLNALGIKTKIAASETYQYPEEKRPIHYRWRGRHRLTVKQNGAMRCTACMMCETTCPCDCIHIVPGESPDPNIEKFPEEFYIDILRCCFCGMCAEACPVDAIRMDVIDTELAAYSRDVVYSKEFLLGMNQSKPWEKWDINYTAGTSRGGKAGAA